MKILAVLITIVFAVPAFADKPEWAGKGKPSSEQLEAHKAKMQAKEDELEKEQDDAKEGLGKQKDKMKGKKEKVKKEKKDKSDKVKKEKKDKSEKENGLEKQKTSKTEDAMKELDKGSNKGQEARSKRKKWWKFWGE